ncbi:unnamed protein product [Ambrosiozyma monospora]|uniref:Unnamed protein product n=1 Tax=Ambrosiozyma monospora TaxID=43982 RepID=A0A9W7DJ44_AMBMO|nr:unnamed protein product [Ambrosiozyma monospora]
MVCLSLLSIIRSSSESSHARERTFGFGYDYPMRICTSCMCEDQIKLISASWANPLQNSQFTNRNFSSFFQQSTGSANYQNVNTHETEQDPPSYENITSQMGDEPDGLPPVTGTAEKYPITFETEHDPVEVMTPERRKKMLRNLYIILGILVIVYIIWIVAVAVSLNRAGDYDDYY